VFLVLVGLDAAKPTQEDFFILPCRHTNWGSINFNGVSNAFSDSLPDPDSLDIQTTSDCITCIDPPGDGDPTLCTPTNQYRLEASVDDYGAYIYNSTIPTWRLTPFWGGIIEEVTEVLENANVDSPYHRELPYHKTFDLERRVTIETKLTPNGKLSFSLTMYDMILRLYYTSTSFAVSNARIKATSDAIRLEGAYIIAQDNFNFTEITFENLDIDVDVDSNLGPVVDPFISFARLLLNATDSQLEGRAVTVIKNQITDTIDDLNRNSPNLFLRSLLDFPELANILPLLDQAIMDLLQDDVSAVLNVALPSCGDIDRDGLIELDVSTN